jgi:hypothetical protein
MTPGNNWLGFLFIYVVVVAIDHIVKLGVVGEVVRGTGILLPIELRRR